MLQYAAELSRLRFLRGRGRGKEKEGIGLLTTPSTVQTPNKGRLCMGYDATYGYNKGRELNCHDS